MIESKLTETFPRIPFSNFTRITSGLNREAEYVVSGSVLTNTGKSLAWVRMTIHDNSTNRSLEVTTDGSGRYEAVLMAPWDTDGKDVAITCHHGAYTQTLYLEDLEVESVLDFSISSGPEFTTPVLYLALVLCVVGLGLVGYYLFSSRANI